MSTITPFLWFDTQAQEAMAFYTSIFKDSLVISSNPMTVQFELLGQRFIGLNAGPHHQFTEESGRPGSVGDGVVTRTPGSPHRHHVREWRLRAAVPRTR